MAIAHLTLVGTRISEAAGVVSTACNILTHPLARREVTFAQVRKIRVRSCNPASSLIGNLTTTSALLIHCGYARLTLVVSRITEVAEMVSSARIEWGSFLTGCGRVMEIDCGR